MCIAPKKVEKSVLVVPAGIAKAATLKAMASAIFPMSKYIRTGEDKWLRNVLLPMAIDEKNIYEADLEMLKYSLEHIVGMSPRIPNITKAKDLRKFTMPTFIIVAERDIMFPSEKILAKAKKNIPNLKTHIMKGQGQKFVLSDIDIDMIVRFINE